LFGTAGGARTLWVAFVGFQSLMSRCKLGANTPTTAQTCRVRLQKNRACMNRIKY
jgi:hypothetical protein